MVPRQPKPVRRHLFQGQCSNRCESPTEAVVSPALFAPPALSSHPAPTKPVWCVLPSLGSAAIAAPDRPKSLFCFSRCGICRLLSRDSLPKQFAAPVSSTVSLITALNHRLHGRGRFARFLKTVVTSNSVFGTPAATVAGNTRLASASDLHPDESGQPRSD